MTLNEYQMKAMLTSSKRTDLTVGILGLCGETGELADAWKKSLAQGHTFDYSKAAMELGDVLWYVASVAQSLGFGLEDVAKMNIGKLKARYPDGFSTERSLNRAP